MQDQRFELSKLSKAARGLGVREIGLKWGLLNLRVIVLNVSYDANDGGKVTWPVKQMPHVIELFPDRVLTGKEAFRHTLADNDDVLGIGLAPIIEDTAL